MVVPERPRWGVSDQKKVLKFVEKLHFSMEEQS